MSWLVSNKHRFFRQQAVMFILIGMLVVIFCLQLAIPYERQLPFIASTENVEWAWSQVRSGHVDASVLWAFCTLITCAFLHGGLDHITGNLLFFWAFGALVNELLGWRWLLGIVLFTALGSSTTHVIMEAGTRGTLVGASGIVYGFMGAYLGLATRWKLPNPHIWPLARPVPPTNLVILALVYVFINYRDLFYGAETNFAYGGHAGGFTAGLFLTCFITPRPKQAAPR